MSVAPVNVTVTLAVPAPSPTFCVTGPIVTTGAASSLTMVVIALAVPMVALLTLLSVRMMLSSVSYTASPVTVTTTVLLWSPGLKVRVPVAAAPV